MKLSPVCGYIFGMRIFTIVTLSMLATLFTCGASVYAQGSCGVGSDESVCIYRLRSKPDGSGKPATSLILIETKHIRPGWMDYGQRVFDVIQEADVVYSELGLGKPAPGPGKSAGFEDLFTRTKWDAATRPLLERFLDSHPALADRVFTKLQDANTSSVTEITFRQALNLDGNTKALDGSRLRPERAYGPIKAAEYGKSVPDETQFQKWFGELNHRAEQRSLDDRAALMRDNANHSQFYADKIYDLLSAASNPAGAATRVSAEVQNERLAVVRDGRNQDWVRKIMGSLDGDAGKTVAIFVGGGHLDGMVELLNKENRFEVTVFYQPIRVQDAGGKFSPPPARPSKDWEDKHLSDGGPGPGNGGPGGSSPAGGSSSDAMLHRNALVPLGGVDMNPAPAAVAPRFDEASQLEAMKNEVAQRRSVGEGAGDPTSRKRGFWSWLGGGSNTEDTVIFSLRAALARIKSGKDNRKLREVGGITRIGGFILDKAGEDILLYGVRKPRLPALHLDDFLVALKYGWNHYARLEGNTIYLSQLACSIDPYQEVSARLDAAARQINAAADEKAMDAAAEGYVKVCHENQKVSVFGIPPETRFAKVMVEADYRMKGLVDGTADVDDTAFKSLNELYHERLIRDLREGGHPISRRMANRFWFRAGEASYASHAGVTSLREVQLVLLTEKEYVGGNGARIQSGEADPLSADFSAGFAVHFGRIKAALPIFAELENLYRWTTLQAILKARGDGWRLPFDLEENLKNYRGPEEMTPSELPGKGTLQKEIFRNGGKIFTILGPTCGGVSMELKPEAAEPTASQATAMEGLLARAVHGRDPDQGYWELR